MWLLLGGGAMVLSAILVLSLLVALSGDSAGEFSFRNRIHVVEVEGELLDSRPIIEELKRYEDAESVPAILLNVNSPGGGVAASQEIYREIKRLREEKNKIIVTYMSAVGASGAYYLAVPSNRSIATAGTIVGGLGVIAVWVTYGEVREWA
jgi:protease-4